MAKETKEKSYWPHLILGFLIIGMSLGYWTVKSATSIPVQESNEYMLKYQIADMNINDIVEQKARFDKDYTIKLLDAKMGLIDIEHSKVARSQKVVELTKGANTFKYQVTKKDGTPIVDANVSFLLTRPHTVKDDNFIKVVKPTGDMYIIKDIDIQKPGRYTLQFRAIIGDKTGYSQISAYLNP